MSQADPRHTLLRQAAHPLIEGPAAYDRLLDLIGDARFVLIGEASHGTHEFYRERAVITQRLIQERGFCAVAVEADWPDAYRVNRYVQGRGDDRTALDALGNFTRFPLWMWRNADVLDFIGWLRDHNDHRPANQGQVGFYGLDLYSLTSSAAAVIQYLEGVDPEAAQRARYRYACFGHFGEDPQSYGYAANFGMTQSCEDEAVKQLVELRRNASAYVGRDGAIAEDEYFFAERNARLVENAEEYYRTMFSGRVSSWNLRDRHMAETLDALADHLSRDGQPAKIVVWEHNSHLGDARATQMGEEGELNVGQLVREKYGRDAFLIGQTTYTGTVTAASQWDTPGELKHVTPGLPGSVEGLFHALDRPRFMLSLRESGPAVDLLRRSHLERAIGVIYRPDTERVSHYFRARLADQFDAVLHFDQTRAVEPLDRDAGEASEEAPETFPTGI